MLEINPDQQRQPIGGHHFVEIGLMLRGDTLNEVVEKVRNLRIANAIPEGDPEQDVLEYYKKRFPWMVNVSEAAPQPQLEADYIRWRHWVHSVWRNPPKKLVTSKEAKMRWEVCEKCPHNKEMKWKETDESAEVSRRSFMLRAGQDTPDFLGYCSLHRADICALSFLDKPEGFSAKQKTDTAPPVCWVSNG